MSSLDSAKGFTLLEVLVAISILALSVTIVIQVFSRSLRSLTYSEQHMRAMIRAEEAINRLSLNKETTEGRQMSKTEEGFIINTEVSPVYTQRTKDIPLSLYELTVTVLWQKDKKERSVTLKTYKAVERRP